MNPRIFHSKFVKCFKGSILYHSISVRSSVDKYRTTCKLIKKTPDFAVRAYAPWGCIGLHNIEKIIIYKCTMYNADTFQVDDLFGFICLPSLSLIGL